MERQPEPVVKPLLPREENRVQIQVLQQRLHAINMERVAIQGELTQRWEADRRMGMEEIR